MAKDVRQGQSLTFTGSGFEPGESVAGSVHSDVVDLGTAVTDAKGNVAFTWNVPANFALGQHTVILEGETSKRKVEATFTVLANQAMEQGKDDLANTGANTAALWGAAMLMALLGAGIVLGNRRRAGLHK